MGRIERTRRVGKSRRAPPLTESWRPHYNRRRHALRRRWSVGKLDGKITLATGEGAFVGGSGRAHVSAAKMGLVGLARGLASEFASHNIRVNVVSPGSIDTARANPEWYQGRPPSATGIPLGRQGTVDEIAATCLFLVSDDAGFVTGQTIHVNGGIAYY